MSDIERSTILEEMHVTGRCDRPRKLYEAPRLVRYGDVRDVTLGPSPGTGESGNPITFRA